MKKNQRYKLIKKYPILIGFMLIAALMGSLFFQKYWSERPQGQWTVLTDDLARGATIDQFQNPEDLIKYTVAALKNQDLDLVLRACAIDENLLANPFYAALDDKKRFGYDMVLPPSANYEEYRPLSSAILMKHYTEQYAKFQKQCKNLGDIKLKGVGILHPEEQLASKAISQTTRFCNEWGASRAIQIAALLQTNQGDYMISFTVTKYSGYWKIFDFGAEMTEMENGQFIKLTDQEEFDSTVGKRNVLSFTKELDDEMLYGEGLVKKNGENEKPEDIKHPEKEILPPNYCIVGASYGKNQKDTIQKFILSLQKKDPIKSLSYCDMGNLRQDYDKVTYEMISTQADFAKQLYYLYYGILGEPYFQGEKKLAWLDQTAGEILEKLNPQYIPYMYSNEILKVADNKVKGEEQYVAFYSLNGKNYMIGYTLVKVEKGWQIISLSAPDQGLEPGEVREVTWEQYQKLVGNK